MILVVLQASRLCGPEGVGSLGQSIGCLSFQASQMHLGECGLVFKDLPRGYLNPKSM